MSVPRGPKATGLCKIQYKVCKICKKTFCLSISSARTTCSRVCQTTASTKVRSYQNGSRKPVYYTKKGSNETVLLDSSWEVRVAERLDELNIEWIRPKPMPWTDSLGKERVYYPDFYLPKIGVYLDPKNTYCMVQDEEKMRVISSQIDIIYGPIDIILDFIEKQGG